MIRNRVTIKQVAQAAGVSTQTVSRVLNERPDVSPLTRERVLAIIHELDYSPNVLARSLIQGRTNTIGVVGYGLGFYGPARILTGIERRANEIGYSLQLSLLRSPETDSGEKAYQNLVNHQVDGIIWAIPETGANRDWLAQEIQTLNIPLVAMNMQPTSGVPIVAIDNLEGGRLATRHLLDQGFRRIGLITGPASWWEAQQRESGWRDCLIEAGVIDLDRLKAVGDWYPASGDYAMTQLLERNPDLDAVFACNDQMALGAYQAARRLGRRIPEDLAVVGFDDVPEAAYYYPALTTIRQPLVELGGQAVNMLAQIIQKQSFNSSNPLYLSPQLTIRDSSFARPFQSRAPECK